METSLAASTGALLLPAPHNPAALAALPAHSSPDLLPCSLEDLPLYGAGISSGASFLLKMPRYIKASA